MSSILSQCKTWQNLKPGQRPVVRELVTRKIVDILNSTEAVGKGTCTDLQALR